MAGDAPARVVSLNLCTDQMARLLAAPGQLVSVTPLARDPRSSAMPEAFGDIPANNARAETIVLQDPDLVLAGTWTTPETVAMLERLGYRVERFQPADSLEAARQNLLRMGTLLGREPQARALVAAFDARLAALRARSGPAPRTALYYALGTTLGGQTLAGDILRAAGLANVADERGLSGYGALPLEVLILADPDLILVDRPYGGHARATELLRHPALAQTGALRVLPGAADWICETPRLLDAVERLVTLREAWAASDGEG